MADYYRDEAERCGVTDRYDERVRLVRYGRAKRGWDRVGLIGIVWRRREPPGNLRILQLESATFLRDAGRETY